MAHPVPNLPEIDITGTDFLQNDTDTIARTVNQYNALADQVNTGQETIAGAKYALRDLIGELRAYATTYLEGADIAATEQAAAVDQSGALAQAADNVQGAPSEYLWLLEAVDNALQALIGAGG
jgi:hypothetical protein